MKLRLLLLAVGVSLLRLGDALKCYSCPAGSREACTNVEQCGDKDSCLSLTATGSDSRAGTRFTQCINLERCDFDVLAATFGLSKFRMNCCQSNLCNSSQSIIASPLIGLMASLAALWLGFC